MRIELLASTALLSVLSIAPVADAVQVHQADTTCDCVATREAYDNLNIECGQTFEYGYMPLSTNLTQLKKTSMLLNGFRLANGEEFCARFFEQIKKPYCMRARYMNKPSDSTKWYAKSWCYVSKKCEDLNGGKKVNGTKAAWKVCKDGDAPDLTKMSVKELVAVSKEHGIDASTLITWAYHHVDAAGWSLSEARIEALQKRKLPVTVFPSLKKGQGAGAGSLRKQRLIINGDQIWKQEQATATGDGTGIDSDRPSDWWRTNCIKGC